MIIFFLSLSITVVQRLTSTSRLNSSKSTYRQSVFSMDSFFKRVCDKEIDQFSSFFSISSSYCIKSTFTVTS